ncbi:MAG: hypothetical protein RML12_07900 [Xanthomonadales bacterium]|nr:hypothetical protein [Xanthomonadales bacterium]
MRRQISRKLACSAVGCVRSRTRSQRRSMTTARSRSSGGRPGVSAMFPLSSKVAVAVDPGGSKTLTWTRRAPDSSGRMRFDDCPFGPVRVCSCSGRAAVAGVTVQRRPTSASGLPRGSTARTTSGSESVLSRTRWPLPETGSRRMSPARKLRASARNTTEAKPAAAASTSTVPGLAGRVSRFEALPSAPVGVMFWAS